MKKILYITAVSAAMLIASGNKEEQLVGYSRPTRYVIVVDGYKKIPTVRFPRINGDTWVYIHPKDGSKRAVAGGDTREVLPISEFQGEN